MNRRRSRAEPNGADTPHRGPGDLLNLAPVAALVIAVLGVTALGPRIVDGVRDRLHHGDRPTSIAVESNVPLAQAAGTAIPTTSDPPTSDPPTSDPPTVEPSTVDPSTVDPSATTLPTLAPPPAPVAPGTSAVPATTTAALPSVTMLQVVPATRDVIVLVDGVALASDSLGQIELEPDQDHATVQVVGREADPAVQQLRFIGWADGSTEMVRSLDSIVGPVAQLGFTVESQVTVAAAGVDDANSSSVTFSSESGLVDLIVGRAEWLPSVRAVESANGLVPQSLTYTAQSISTSGASTPLSPQQFVASPEALWSVLT